MQSEPVDCDYVLGEVYIDNYQAINLMNVVPVNIVHDVGRTDN